MWSGGRPTIPRAVDGGEIDAGNARFAGQESLIVFDNVFVPYEHAFMDGG
jgi:4-hydroxybutyryl-CoA dehydratase/vinylacetyl-CoA-Delta-isomerase